ncbi:hypothetical protein LshimejAT787_0205820 [Lyophyllum shimeji]|uniref:Uncharacterized protein n=1 Tax=Lyophyllum shimeji TaxID=47721 RepID=A0A9P3PFE9_LYOSH|nr:hypothetical protein LshimejAT787_0205820 [Lyophyllum shimeji]
MGIKSSHCVPSHFTGSYPPLAIAHSARRISLLPNPLRKFHAALVKVVLVYSKNFLEIGDTVLPALLPGYFGHVLPSH